MNLAEKLDRMAELLRTLQSNHPEVRRTAAAEGMELSQALRKTALARRPAKNTATIEAYCGEYDLHVERLATATRDADGNHLDLLGAMTALDKLRGFAGFDLQ